MVVFFVIAVILLLVVLALIIEPLVRRFDNRSEDPRGGVVDLGRNRLAELKEKRNAGEISEAEYLSQVRDLETQVADDLRAPGAGTEKRGLTGGRWAGLVVVLVIPLLSGVLYFELGQPRALSPDAGTPTPAASGEVSSADIDAMVARLASRLEENPEDSEGWFMLGRSYMALNRYREAAEAFRRLREVAGDQPDVLVSEATALAMAGDGNLAGQPARLVQRALALNPAHPQGLWLAATAAYQAGDHETALDYYRRVEPMMEGAPLQQVQAMIRELTARNAGQDGTGPADKPTGAAVSLEVNVSLAPALQKRVSDDDTVFIFARAVDGPPMPLAVARRTVSQLPATVILDDSSAMTSELSLSAFEQVRIGARVSSTGQAAARPGDLEGQSIPVPTTTSEAIDVTIDRVVPGAE